MSRKETHQVPHSKENKRISGSVLIPGLVIFAALASIFAIGIGAISISPSQVIAILLKAIGISVPVAFSQEQEAVLLTLRLPRVVLALLTGAGIASSGAAIQALFRNPLADPGLIGISSGAAAGAVGMIVLGVGVWSGSFITLILPASAFVAALLTSLFVYKISTRGGRTQAATMLLSGIAVNALSGAFIGLMTFVASDVQLRNITFWSLGSLGGAQWESVSIMGVIVVPSVLILTGLSKKLNLLLLGEREAEHLGMNVQTLKRVVIIIAALAVGSSVALCGIIAFIGLVVPHLVRLVSGPDNRIVVPGAAILGGGLLCLADTAARTIATPAELPLGIVTAAIGAPFFLWILTRNHLRGEL